MFGCDWLFQFITDEFLVVGLPRVLVLRNRRLGILYKALQLVAIVLSGAYCTYSRLFLLGNEVTAWGVNLWQETAMTNGQTPPLCESPESYASSRVATFSYKPTTCKVLPNEEANHMDSGKLFLPTFIDDTLVWEGMGDQCGAALRDACSRHSVEAVYKEADGGQCSCALREQFIVQDAEEQRIRLVYGYESDLSNGERQDLRLNGILSSKEWQGPQHDMTEQTSTLVTEFLAPDGSSCTFGGKSQWQQADALGGISGTLDELLACAGVTLDSNPETLGASALLAPPHLRTMGFGLALHLVINQDLLGRVKCVVRVSVTPATTITWKNDVQSTPFTQMGAVARRHRRAHGVIFNVHVSGTVYTFSWYQLVRSFVDIFVVLQVPSVMMQFIAMYLLGLVSEVYRNTARTKLNICGKFHSSMAKLMLAEVAFRGLVENFSCSMCDLNCLTPQMLLHRLHDIFADLCNEGTLQSEELMNMAAVVFTSMDKNGSGTVCCNEFIEACTDDGEITLQRMARFFDDDDKDSFIGRFFDDTHQTRTQSPWLKKMFDELTVDQNNDPARNDSSGEPIVDMQPGELDSGGIPVDVRRANEAGRREEKQELKLSTSSNDQCYRAIADLDKRMKALEIHCEQALGILREAVEENHLTLSPRGSQCPGDSRFQRRPLTSKGTDHDGFVGQMRKPIADRITAPQAQKPMSQGWITV